MVAEKAAGPHGLSPDELAYHRTVVTQMQAAQAAANLWQAHIAAKYRLAEGTQITEAGEFVVPERRLTAVMGEGA